MKYKAKIVADSIGPNGVRLTTMEFDIWKPLLAEFNTHGLQGSRNFPSSRAIPWAKMRKKILEEPHVPRFRKNNPGMQAVEYLSGEEQLEAERDWLEMRDFALAKVEKMGDKDGLNIHKQWLNRALEPWITVTGLVTATDWDNFWNLRLELNDNGWPMAQDEFYLMTLAMKKALEMSSPRELKPGELHAPYIDRGAVQWICDWGDEGRFGEGTGSTEELNHATMMLSAGKCATVSYDNLGDGVNHEKDYKRATEQLLPCGHMSVFQHQAVCLPEVTNTIYGTHTIPERSANIRSGQLRGWTQFRKTLPNEALWVSPRTDIRCALELPEFEVSVL